MYLLSFLFSPTTCFLITPQITLLLFLLSTSNAINHTDCTPGTFFNGTTCDLCPPGTYQHNSGRKTCTHAPWYLLPVYKRTRARYVSSLSQKHVQPQSRRTTQLVASLSACKRCPRGTGSAAYSFQCIACPAGSQISPCDFLGPVVDGLCLVCYRYFLCY